MVCDWLIGLPLPSNQVEFALWLIRYLATGSLFFLGLRAPGLPRRPYMLLINEEEHDVESRAQVGQRGRLIGQQSSWV